MGAALGVLLVYVGLGLNRIAPQQFEVAEGSFVLLLPSDGCVFTRMCKGQLAGAALAHQQRLSSC
jgi:hypothetical protein